MRPIKIIFGIVFLMVSLLPAGIALFLFLILDGRHTLQIIFGALFFLAAALSLFFSGWFLIAKRNLKMSWKSIVLICLSFCCFGLCMAIVIPNFLKARATSSCNPCLNNLRQIDAAANQFALEHNSKIGDPIKFPEDLTPYIRLNSAGKIPPCPSGGVYHINKVGDTPTCSLGTTGTPAHALQ
jgi:ABC-type transport system involved in multi-copper enzyme maturation permease subunit